MRSAAREKARVPDRCPRHCSSPPADVAYAFGGPCRADAVVCASGQDADLRLYSAAERLVIARRWSGDPPGRRPAVYRLSGPRKFIAFGATKFKHATFVGLPAVILALGAVD